MDIEAYHYTYTNQDKPRDRVLSNWTLVIYGEPGNREICLQGIVTSEVNGRPQTPGTNTRITITSPIQSIEGRVVTTQSGSKYYLKSMDEIALDIMIRADFPVDEVTPLTNTYVEYLKTL